MGNKDKTKKKPGLQIQSNAADPFAPHHLAAAPPTVAAGTGQWRLELLSKYILIKNSVHEMNFFCLLILEPPVPAACLPTHQLPAA
ncbi:hypothetical protein Nmel_000648 [Mimus melanotis]